jgi:hypothetical protein
MTAVSIPYVFLSLISRKSFLSRYHNALLFVKLGWVALTPADVRHQLVFVLTFSLTRLVLPLILVDIALVLLFHCLA